MTKDWEKHHARIRELYKEQGKSLQEVRITLLRFGGFHASSRAYKTKLKEWGYIKNRPQRKSSYRATRDQNQDEQFALRLGRPIQPAKANVDDAVLPISMTPYTADRASRREGLGEAPHSDPPKSADRDRVVSPARPLPSDKDATSRRPVGYTTFSDTSDDPQVTRSPSLEADGARRDRIVSDHPDSRVIDAPSRRIDGTAGPKNIAHTPSARYGDGIPDRPEKITHANTEESMARTAVEAHERLVNAEHWHEGGLSALEVLSLAAVDLQSDDSDDWGPLFPPQPDLRREPREAVDAALVRHDWEWLTSSLTDDQLIASLDIYPPGAPIAPPPPPQLRLPELLRTVNATRTTAHPPTGSPYKRGSPLWDFDYGRSRK